MRDLKSEKGAITLYILGVVLFFLIAIVNVNVYLNHKASRVEAEYQQIKESYEMDANEVYAQKERNI